MNTIHKSACVLTLLLIVLNTYAHHNKILGAGKSNCTISFCTPGTPNEKIDCRIFPYYFKSRLNIDATTYSLQCSDGIASLKTSVRAPSYLSVSFASNKQYALSLYLLYPGDSITISILHDSMSFSGKGAARFRCIQAINQVPQFYWAGNERKMNMGYEKLALLAHREDSLYTIKHAILKSYRSTIGRGVANQLIYDLEGEKTLAFLETLSIFTASRDTSVAGEAYRFYSENLLHKHIKTGTAYFINSRTYADAVFRKLLLNLKIRAATPVNSKHDPPVETVYPYIRDNFKGPIRERMLTTALLFYKEESYPFIAPALRIIKNAGFRKVLLERQASGVGHKAFNFQVEGEAGDKVMLTDFAGKLVVANMWFTGCYPSKELEKKLKVVRQYYKNDSSIVFLSISADKDRALWKRSLASGMYSDERVNKNCITNGVGSDHPLFTFFGYTGCPALLIIGPGQRIISKGFELEASPNFTRDMIGLLDKHRQ
jgi:hypothetical protein